MTLADQFREALTVLQEGGLVAMPTDTVFGLIAVAADDAAVRQLYDVKARDHAQPLPLFVGSREQAALIAEPNAASETLIRAFWPGALTIVMAKRPTFASLAAAGGDSIGVRMPNDPLLQELAAQLGPLTGTSANRSGAPECRTAAEVRAQFGDDLDLIIDALCPGGATSTVVDCTDPLLVRVLRDGAIERDAIAGALAGIAGVS